MAVPILASAGEGGNEMNTGLVMVRRGSDIAKAATAGLLRSVERCPC